MKSLDINFLHGPDRGRDAILEKSRIDLREAICALMKQNGLTAAEMNWLIGEVLYIQTGSGVRIEREE